MQVKECLKQKAVKLALYTLAKLAPDLRVVDHSIYKDKLKAFEEALNTPIDIPEKIKTTDYAFTEDFSKARADGHEQLIHFLGTHWALNNPMGPTIFSEVPDKKEQAVG